MPKPKGGAGGGGAASGRLEKNAGRVEWSISDDGIVEAFGPGGVFENVDIILFAF